MAYVAMNPIAIVMDAEKNPPNILGPNLIILRISQRNSIKKIIAKRMLFFNAEYAGLVAAKSQTPQVQKIIVIKYNNTIGGAYSKNFDLVVF